MAKQNNHGAEKQNNRGAEKQNNGAEKKRTECNPNTKACSNCSNTKEK